MDEAKVGRRDVLLTLALVAGCGGLSATAPPARAPNSQGPGPSSAKETLIMEPKALSADHTVKPLSFDPAKLNGLSERMMRSHHENNYAGAVKNLNRVEQELGAITKDTPPFLVTALRERERTLRTISAANHTQSLSLFVPLLVMDMYEHAYQTDYGAAAAKYIDAFFVNIRWDVVEQRLATARKARSLFTS